MEEKKRGSFGGSIGFVLAAAGSAVGLGNIWRFPALAAKDGGGLFLMIYLILAVTFGFTLLLTEVAIGRKTKQSPLTAYGKLHRKSGWIGGFACAVPFIIMPYYCVIGGWVLKYFIVFLTGDGEKATEDGFFGSFITSQHESIIFTVIFLAFCALIIFFGVGKGIERVSKVIMPILLIMVVGISIYSLTLKHTDAAGVTTTGLQGLKIYVVPDFDGITFNKVVTTIMDALGQLFYSISVAMGIMVAYGSYVSDDTNMVRSVNQIEIFDTVVAFLAGIMIIPAIYVFQGVEGMKAGPSLMFVALPKVFQAMGHIGNIIGAVFFLMVLFAAVTSAMSILEAVVASMIDKFKWKRYFATLVESALALLMGVAVCLGYNKWYFEAKLPNTPEGGSAQLLDIMDYISNNILMPIVAIASCILVGWVLKPRVVIEEVTKNGERLGRRALYIVMVKFVAPVLLFTLLLVAFGIELTPGLAVVIILCASVPALIYYLSRYFRPGRKEKVQVSKAAELDVNAMKKDSDREE